LVVHIIVLVTRCHTNIKYYDC